MMLICKGTCNSGIKALDEEVVAARRSDKNTTGPLWDVGLVARLRALTHTLHDVSAPKGVHLATCTVCGTARRSMNPKG